MEENKEEGEFEVFLELDDQQVAETLEAAADESSKSENCNNNVKVRTPRLKRGRKAKLNKTKVNTNQSSQQV